MDLEQLRERLRALIEEMEGIYAPPDDIDEAARAAWMPDDAALARFDQLDAEATELRTKIADAERRLASIAASRSTLGGDDAPRNRGPLDPPNVNRGRDPYDLSIGLDSSEGDLRARVETALERDTVTPDEVKTAIMRTASRAKGGRRGLYLRALITGSDVYRSAFTMLCGGHQAMWSDAQRQAAVRAQALADAAGGFAVPFQLDPTFIGINELSINPIRRIARVVQTMGNEWNGVTAGDADWEWAAERAEAPDSGVTLAQPTIPVHKAHGFIPFSIEIEGDWRTIDSDLRRALSEGRDMLEAEAHIKGTGVGQPTGIETALDGTTSEIDSLVAETFGVADLYNLQRLLPPRYRMAGPVWVMNVGTAGDIRQFDTSGGGLFWANLAQGTPESLLGWRWEESSFVDDSPDINAAVTADNFVLFVGDWSRYVLVDRVGMNVELIPHLFHTANNRPSGQRGLYAWTRHGADSVDDNAFRVLNVDTAA